MPSMLQWVLLLLLTGVSFVGCMPRGGAGPSDGAPSNITVMFLSHTSVHVNWTVNMDNVEKYDVTYKPTDASFKVVIVVAGNSESVVLDQLLPDTQYQMWVQAFRAGRRFRSRQIVFRTLADPDAPQVTGVPFLGAPRPAGVGGASASSPGQGGSSKANKSPVIPPNPPVPQDFIQVWSTVRGVEVGIVLLVLLVWVGAIVLFFNRWGKIRMLLPYQPDYKEQLKVPGTGACGGASGAPCAGQHATSCSQCAPHKCPSFPVCHNFDNAERLKPVCTRQAEFPFLGRHHLHWPAHCSADDADESWLRTRSSIQIHRPLAPLVRSRVNSAIYISAECQHAAAAAASGQRGAAAGVSGSSGGYAGSARTLAASLLASGLARPWARRARSAENIPLRTAGGGGGGASADDDEDDADDGDEEATAAARSRKRLLRRGQFEMPVLSVSGPSPPGDGDGDVELEQHL